jgi:putative ABC transport system permease protein
MASIFTISILQSAIELGLIYSFVVLALFISFSILNIADLSTDGCFTLGCAVAASMTLAGHPVLALVCAVGAGVLSGFVTAFLQTRLGVESILAGIIVNTGLYTINIAVMGFSSNLNLFKCDSIFTLTKDWIQKRLGEGAYEVLAAGGWYRLILVALLVVVIGVLLSIFLGTRLGLSIRATGDNAAMVKASSINPKHTITVGLCVSSALTALSGGILAQYQKSCDINLGTGMVTIALASLIIGETLVGKGTMLRRITGVIFGSCLYRFIVAVAIRINVPAECLKLVSAIIVAAAIAFPYLQKNAVFTKNKYIQLAKRRKGGAS